MNNSKEAAGIRRLLCKLRLVIKNKQVYFILRLACITFAPEKIES